MQIFTEKHKAKDVFQHMMTVFTYSKRREKKCEWISYVRNIKKNTTAACWSHSYLTSCCAEFWKLFLALGWGFVLVNVCIIIPNFSLSIFQITFEVSVSFHISTMIHFPAGAHLWGQRERAERRVQVKGQRLAAVAVRLYQLLRRHTLKLCEMIHWRIIKVRWLCPLRVERPSMVCKITEGVRHSGVKWVVFFSKF